MAKTKSVINFSSDIDTDEQNINYNQISSYFGKNVFAGKNVKDHLLPNIIKELEKVVQSGEHLSRKMADEIAEGMKQWALNRGVTHYTHWFHPLRGSTAEKHDAFFEPTGIDTGIEVFSGKSLVQQEPDASSFPSGGMRNTFEARGYSAWDPSSPAFIIEKASGKTLCIPTVFVSYTGQALDYKTPMLRSAKFVQDMATEVCSLFDKKVKHTTVSLGIEQEYFVVDYKLFRKRQDLMLAGRTLLGHAPAKGQQLDDHYFGSIPERVFEFMTDLEKEALKLGIPLKTRHNEVAPCQFEVAPMFEPINLAIDHNSLLMDLMESISAKHDLKVLLHEKPYKGVNGSGKHNNWSLITDTGVNLFSPGTTPIANLQFLTFFINTIKAVSDHDSLLRASISTASNDHRLGANEAPPAIISVYIGSFLSSILHDFEKEKSNNHIGETGEKTLDIPNIPPILQDNTDRNRTSPFAFTGNKFELRAVGSSDNCSSSMVVLNTIVGNQLKQFLKDVSELQKKGALKENAIQTVLRNYIRQSSKVIFEGNGYSTEWEEEAQRRGLDNIKTTPHALAHYLKPSSKRVFIENGILSEEEIEARTDIRYESYALKLQIEGRVLADMVKTNIIPPAIEFHTRILENIKLQKELGIKPELYQATHGLAGKIGYYIQQVQYYTKLMVDERKKANLIDSHVEKALAYCENVLPLFDDIRYQADKLERLIDDSLWQIPKYRELLYIK